MKKIAAICLVLSVSLQAAEPKKTNGGQGSIKLSPLSTACYGTEPGKCKSGDTLLSYNDFVSHLEGTPATVKAVYYFKDRDDKVLLEYAIAEDEFTGMMTQSIISRLIGMPGPTDDKKLEYLNEQAVIAEKRCPIKGGCKNLLGFIEDLKKSDDWDHMTGSGPN